MNTTIDIVLDLLNKQIKQGVIDGFEVDISKSGGTSTSVRLGKLENISNYQNQNLDITVYKDNKSAHSSSADLSFTGIKSSINSAVEISKYTQSDKFHSLAPIDRLAFEVPDLNMFFPWELTGEVALNLAIECENAGQENLQISNSDGAEISSFDGQSWYLNSNDLIATRKSSAHSIYCSLIAQKGDEMQTGYEYQSVLDYKDFYSPELIGKKAAENTIKKLGGGLIKSGNYPVIFTNKVSSSIISSILGGLSGSSQYKKSTFLEGSLGSLITGDNINISENPLTQKTIGAKAYDDDGVLKQQQFFVKNGVVQSYIMGQYSANQMQSKTTGNAGGVANVVVDATKSGTLEDMLKTMDNGIVVDELMGQGVNGITGDYSRAMGGFLVENGIITKRISGVTIAGNLKQMIKDIEIIDDEIDLQKNIKVGNILIKNMIVAGS